jgi:hypothetical protein
MLGPALKLYTLAMIVVLLYLFLIVVDLILKASPPVVPGGGDRIYFRVFHDWKQEGICTKIPFQNLN